MGYEIVDNVLDDFDEFRLFCDKLEFSDRVNPVDGVSYPHIAIVPSSVKEEIKEKLSAYLGVSVNFNAVFIRLSPKGVDCPHQAHTDTCMGQYSFMLYLNRRNDCEGGTSLVIHKKTGLYSHPINDKQLKIWENDCNNTDAWQILTMCSMVPNRGFIFDSTLMHRAEPVGGFGESAKDARMVLTVFFDVD